MSTPHLAVNLALVSCSLLDSLLAPGLSYTLSESLLYLSLAYSLLLAPLLLPAHQSAVSLQSVPAVSVLLVGASRKLFELSSGIIPPS